MRFQYGTAVFRVELRADEPAQGRNLDDFHQVRFGIDTHAFHACLFEFGFVVIVELVAVAVAFLDMFGSVRLINLRVRVEHTFVGTQAHCSAHIGDGFLFFHDVDDVVRGLFVHFAAVGIGITQYVACEFNCHALHAQADAECRHIVRAAILDGNEFPFDAALAESRADDDAVHIFQRLFHVVFVQFFAINEMDVRLAVVVGGCL